MSDIERMDYQFDPQRCQHVIPTQGQCVNKAMPDAQNCKVHGGWNQNDSVKKNKLKLYKLNLLANRAGELSSSADAFNLRDEIGMLRLLIEEKWNLCNSTNELILMSQPLSELILRVEKLTASCSKAEIRLGQLLDRTQVQQFAQTIIDIIAKRIPNVDVIEAIADDISTAFGEL